MPATQKPYVIVVGIDYSESGNLALERGLEIAIGKPAAEVHVVHVLPVAATALKPTSLPASAAAYPPVAEAADDLRSYVERKVIEFRARHLAANLGCLETVRAHQRVNVPSEEVAQLAADVDADLVVVGTHGRRGMSRLVLGSVAETTVRWAPCPVLVVRPKATPAPGPALEPPCPRCVEARRASGGAEFWCAQHRERHGQRHTYHQGDRSGADTNLPLVVQR